VHLLYLPAYTSSETQPLDVCVYSPLKDRFQREISKLGIRSSSSPIQKRACIDTYFKVREIAMSSSNIQSAFAATGIYPLDRTKIMNSNKLVHQRDLESQNTMTEMLFSSIVVDDLGSLSPRTRRHLIKAEAAATGEAIIQQAHNQQLQKQIDLLSTSKRKARDKPDPNKVFKKRKEVKKQHWLNVQKKSTETLAQSNQELAKIYKEEQKKNRKNRATQGNTSN
jgi:DDE superfamily endonuclease